MNFHTRKWIKPEDLNPNGTLFGGRLLQWIDEEAALYAIIQLENPKTVTKYMSEINFKSASVKGDIIEDISNYWLSNGLGISRYIKHLKYEKNKGAHFYVSKYLDRDVDYDYI